MNGLTLCFYSVVLCFTLLEVITRFYEEKVLERKFIDNEGNILVKNLHVFRDIEP
jgi:hypothetical protein